MWDSVYGYEITFEIFKQKVEAQGLNECNRLDLYNEQDGPLCYELDKDSTSNWKLPLTNLVSQIK